MVVVGSGCKRTVLVLEEAPPGALPLLRGKADQLRPREVS